MMLLEEFEHPKFGLGYRAKEVIPKGTRIAFYTGRLEKTSAKTGRHVISIGVTEIRYNLTVDRTPPVDESLPLGSLQLVLFYLLSI